MGAWEMLVALAVGAAAARAARRRALAFVAAGAAAWLAIDAARGQLPVGSFGLETLLTAVLVRIAPSEAAAAVASRALLVALGGGALAGLRGLGRLARRLGRRRLATAALALLAAACGGPEPEGSPFEPARPGDGAELVRLAFEDAARAPAEHPVLPEGARTRAACLACHAAVAAATDLPAERKGFHEVHAARARAEHECVSCHRSAGSPGFPGERPGERVRREAHERCAGCHSLGGAPFWQGASR